MGNELVVRSSEFGVNNYSCFHCFCLLPLAFCLPSLVNLILPYYLSLKIMQELTDLRNSIVQGRYADALEIVDELENMSKRDIFRKIDSFLVRLIAHLIKQQLEKRLTNSWAASISDSLRQIQKLNERNKNSWYVSEDGWQELVEEAIEAAIDEASVEVLGGCLTSEQVSQRIDRQLIISLTLSLLSLTHTSSIKELPGLVRNRLNSL